MSVKVRNIFLGLVLATAGLGFLLWPGIRTMRMVNADVRTFRAIQELRGSIEAYAREHGKPPLDLTGIPLPKLELYCLDGDYKHTHRHRRITEVELRPGGGLAKLSPDPAARQELDLGKWLYDPQTGAVVLGCSGTDTKHGRPWYVY